MAAGFVWYELMTSGDVHAAAKFYADVVGWDVRDSGMPGMTYLLFGKDGKDVGGMMAWHGTSMNKPPKWVGHIGTADVEAEADAVQADGGSVVRPPQDIPNVGRFAVVADPQGVEYLLFQPNTSSMPPRLAQNEVGNVGWHELLTSDWESAWEFYAKHYGWQKDYAHDMGSMGIYQTFRIDSDRYTGAMMNLPTDGKFGQPRWQFYFQVPSVDDAVATIERAGGTVTMGPHEVPGGSRTLLGVDPQGGSFALSSSAT